MRSLQRLFSPEGEHRRGLVGVPHLSRDAESVDLEEKEEEKEGRGSVYAVWANIKRDIEDALSCPLNELQARVEASRQQHQGGLPCSSACR